MKKKNFQTITVTIVLGKKDTLKAVKREFLRETLKITSGNISHAARLLGSPRQVVQRQVRGLLRPRATIRKGFLRAVDRAVGRVRRDWNLKTKARSK